MATPTKEDRLVESRLRIIDDSLQIAVDNFRYLNNNTIRGSKYSSKAQEIAEIEKLCIKVKNRVRRLTE